MSDPAKIYVAGHRGMVGSAIVRALEAQGQRNIVTRTHAELDLTDQAAVRAFFAAERPDQVYLAAAKVGGIHANDTYPAEFIYQNLMVEANVIDAAFRNGVRKLLFLGSSCIYLCKVRDPEDLARKMELFLALSPDEKAMMARSGREKMERNFDEKIVIDEYLSAIC